MVNLEEIRRDIASPLRSLRLKAIERLLQDVPPDPEREAILQKRLQEEKDEECQALLRQALAIVSPAIDRAPDVPGQGEFFSLPDPERLRYVRSMSPKIAGTFSGQAPEWFAREKNPIIAGALLKTFGRIWPREHLPVLASNFLNYSTTVRMAVLDLLIEKSPDSLINYLPTLLTSQDQKLHLMAIRGLFKIDVPEGLKYLEWYLFNEDRPAREMAIIDLFHFPFEHIKPVLFNYFSIESEMDLLEKAGSLFEINPDLEVPFRLMEIAETASPEKTRLLKEIIKKACGLIQCSGILQDRFPAYLAKFQTWVNRRSSQRYLQQIFFRLKETPEAEWPELEPGLARALENAEFRQVYPAIFSWGLTPAMAQFLEKFQTSIGTAPGPEPLPVPAETIIPEKPAFAEPVPAAIPASSFPTDMREFLKLEEREQKRFFSRFTTVEGSSRLELARQIVQNPDVSRKIQAAALRCCGTQRSLEFADLAEAWLKSNDEELQIGALAYLAETNREMLSLHLRKSLHSSSGRVQREAVRLLQSFDPKEALGFIRVLLESRNPIHQESGLAAISGFDFSIVRQTLFAFLEKDLPLSIFESGLSLFRANPDAENLYLLFKLRQGLAHDRRELVTSAEIQMKKDLLAIGAMAASQEADLLNRMEKRYAEEQEQKRRPAKAYAFQKLRGNDGKSTESFLPIDPGEILSWLSRLPAWTFFLVLPLIGFLVWPKTVPEAPENLTQVNGKPATASPRNLPRNEPGYFISGTVGTMSVQPPCLPILTSTNQRFLVTGGDDAVMKAPAGQRVDLVVAPLKILPDGTIIARFIRVRQNPDVAPGKPSP